MDFQEPENRHIDMKANRATWVVPYHHWDFWQKESHYTLPNDAGCGLIIKFLQRGSKSS